MSCLYLTTAISLCLVLAGSAGASSSSFMLVGGDTRAAICVPPNPSPEISLAASEIAEYIEQMSSAKLEVVETSTPPAGAIVIGKSNSGLSGESYSISIRDGRLHLAGACGRSVLYAAYDLLERLGCRWLAPKFNFYRGSSELVPKSARLVLKLDADVVETPKLKLRKLYVEEGHSHNRENLLQMIDWMSKSRLNTLVVPTDYQGSGRVKWDNWRDALTPELRKRDIQIEVGGHGYQNFISAEMEQGKLFEVHPEWFGMNLEGERERANNRVFCTSNPAAVDYLTGNVTAYLKSHPEIDIFDFWPPDGARWCECPNCKKLGTPADRQSRLMAHVLAEARSRGIKSRFECIAYAVYTDPPANPPMDTSVLIDFCPIDQCFEVQIDDPSAEQNKSYTDDLLAWRKGFSGDISIYSYYRKYAWQSRPIIIPHYMQKDLQWYMKQRMAGMSTYAEPGDWLTYELNHYTLARLAWNPNVDINAIISDFCIFRFPKFASQARRVYSALEDVARKGCRIPFTSLKPPADLAACIERLKTANNALAQAAGDSALSTSVDYALRDLAIQKQISEGGSKTDRAAMVDELAAFLASHKNQGLFVDGGRLSKANLYRSYDAGK